MRYLFIALLFGCVEEITPIVKSNEEKISISSNDYTVVKVTIYNDKHRRTVTHYPNDVRYTNVYLPKGDYFYSSDCGSGLVVDKNIFLECH